MFSSFSSCKQMCKFSTWLIHKSQTDKFKCKRFLLKETKEKNINMWDFMLISSEGEKQAPPHLQHFNPKG